MHDETRRPALFTMHFLLIVFPFCAPKRVGPQALTQVARYDCKLSPRFTESLGGFVVYLEYPVSSSGLTIPRAMVSSNSQALQTSLFITAPFRATASRLSKRARKSSVRGRRVR